MFYFENATYVTNTAIVKLSLITQYLRIFKAGTMHRICMTLMVIIGTWGFAYGFMAWFPCRSSPIDTDAKLCSWPAGFPPQAFYDSLKYPNAVCYGFGFTNPKDFISLFESHTALNMVFDLTIFLTPMVLFTKPNLRMQNILAMAGIFVIGAV